MKECVIMRGLPGSGKSTYVRTVLAEQMPNAVICSADQHFEDESGAYHFNPRELPNAHQACFRKFLAAVQAGKPVIVDNTAISLWEMSPYVLASEAHGYVVKLIHVVCDPEVCIERNTHGVPADAIRAMAKRFEQPLPWWNSQTVENN